MRTEGKKIEGTTNQVRHNKETLFWPIQFEIVSPKYYKEERWIGQYIELDLMKMGWRFTASQTVIPESLTYEDR